MGVENMAFVENRLEDLIGKEKFKVVKKSEWYNFSVEAFIMNTFCYVTAAPVELLIAGMDFNEHIKTRALGALVNTMTGRPYGVWRDFVFKKFNVDEESSSLKKYAADTLAFMGFQLPFYWINMTIAGVEFDEMVRSSIPLTFMAGGLGRPYGIYLDCMREQFGVKSNIGEEIENGISNN